MKLQQKFVQTQPEAQQETQQENQQEQPEENFQVQAEDNSLFDFQGLKFTKGVEISQKQITPRDQNILAQSQQLESNKKRSQTAVLNKTIKTQFINKSKKRILQSATTNKLKLDLEKLDFNLIKQNTQDNSQSFKSLKTTKLTDQKIQKIQELSQQIQKIEKIRAIQLFSQNEPKKKSSESDYTKGKRGSKSDFRPIGQNNFNNQLVSDSNVLQSKNEKRTKKNLQKVREYSPQLRNKKYQKEETTSNDSVLNITDTMFNKTANHQFKIQKEDKLPAILIKQDLNTKNISKEEQLNHSIAIITNYSQIQTSQKIQIDNQEKRRQPIIDSQGNFAYDAKFRKPKWAKEKEIKLQTSDEPEETQEHLANSRIRIEDPFTRQPNSNTVFDHIQDHEIAKFIVGTQYLSRCNMNRGAKIFMDVNLASLQLFQNENQFPLPQKNKRLNSINSKTSSISNTQFNNNWSFKPGNKIISNVQVELQTKRNEQYQILEKQIQNQSKYPLINDWQINLKASKYFLKQPKNCPSDKQFQQVFKENKHTQINNQSVKKLIRQLSPDGVLFDQEQLEQLQIKENEQNQLLSEKDERQVDLDQEQVINIKNLQSLEIDTDLQKKQNYRLITPQSKQKNDHSNQLDLRLQKSQAINSSKKFGFELSPSSQNATKVISPYNQMSEKNREQIEQVNQIMKVPLLGINALNQQIADLDQFIFLEKAFDEINLDQVLKKMVIWSHNFKPNKEQRIQSYLSSEPIQVQQIYNELKDAQELQYKKNKCLECTILEDKAWPLQPQILNQIYLQFFKQIQPVENIERYSYLFEKLLTSKEQIKRNKLQLKIMNEFERLTKLLHGYQLIYDSSFQQSSYQIDFTDRMIFQQAVLNSLNIKVPQIKNYDVFKAKQKNWILQKISERNVQILEEPSIDQFWHHQRPISEVWNLIWSENFNFTQNLYFYRQWYTNWIFSQAIKNKGEDIGGGFSNVKQMYETIQIRQQENLEGKKQRFHPRHTSWNELQRYIYQGQWINILDEKFNLIKNVDEFEIKQKFILKKFLYKQAKFDKKMKLGNDKLTIGHLFFFYTFQIDDENPGLIQYLTLYENEDYLNPIELRFNDVAFRARLINNEEQETYQDNFLPPFEQLEVIYPISQEFFDKKNLHPVLNHQLKLRYISQQKEINKIINFRKELMNFKIETWKKKNIQAHQNYIKQEKKVFKIIRSRSTDSFPLRFQMTYENRDKLELLIYQIENRKIPHQKIIQPEEVLANEGGADESSEPEFTEQTEKEQDEQQQNISQEVDYPYVNPFDEQLIFHKLRVHIELQLTDFTPQLKNKLELIYRYKHKFKKLSKPYTKHLEVKYLEFLSSKYQEKLQEAENNFLKLNKPKKQRKQYLFVPLYNQQKEGDRRTQNDSRILRWLEASLDNQIYSDFITQEDNSLQMCNQKKDFSQNFFINSKIIKKKQQKTAPPQFIFEQDQNRKKKLFPEFFGQNITRSMISDLFTSKNLLTYYKKRQITKKKVQNLNVSSQSLVLSGTNQSSEINISELKDSTKPFLQKLHDSSQVTQYADRQLWKQMRGAICDGNIQLLNNYLSIFAKLLKQRPSSLLNYQEPTNGNTLLHIIIQQNYDTNKKQQVIAALLKEVDMRIDLKNNDGQTAQELASQFGCTLFI